ncbi:MAG TPA: nitrilase-related carbon-nitrogen hydrolase [Gammaproteobacteria bacterium]|jgi:predicted amidohydrolase|nr:nitrilase [Gammaproteobacteria bacterium]HJP39584.1 nitrilase-related carbon-nitrogen hydrolase [Gammaproteobacteria bacterium]
MSDHKEEVPEYIACALQLACNGVNLIADVGEARERIAGTIEKIGGFTSTVVNFMHFFYGVPCRLVTLPEYAVTGFPMKESPAEWREKACFAYDGPEYEALGKIAQDNNVYLAGNVYEVDPNFPQLYFQVSFIIGPSGDVILRYRRLTSTFESTPHDVWDKYLDLYGLDGVFPVARTEIGNLATIASEEILYPEYSRMHVMRGAEVIIHPTSEPGSPQPTVKEIARRARAVENMAYVVSANSASIDNIPIPAYTCSAMSKIVDMHGKILAEAGQGGESMSANAVLDIEGLRRTRRRLGMANILSRQAYGLFAESYAQADFHRANFLLEEGEVVEPPNRDIFRHRQEENIERLIKAGLL